MRLISMRTVTNHEDMLMTRIRTAVSGALAGTGLLAASLAGPATPALAQVDPCVQRVVVSNNSGFVLSYQLSDRTGTTTTPTDRYPVNQSRATDLSFTDYAAGTDVRPIITPYGGGTATPAGQFVSYCDNGQTATYIVTGTIMSYQVTLIGG
ncbi:hypothetical protein GCM10010172_60310 [Paractinoplanes ferrugineus]|uniref:Uncharacterized protein n=1 Tax=Paractinoplanes ferrugineus TaxID=113564 RepID=A0A919JAX2_9ACTN|nr:hypothetical protein [Actinoplanes ferrugineus]GIE16709.1 hypothetical protein Afe05nite_85490 [Actinoplanes ferrugineus]